MKRREDPGTGT